MQGRGPADRGAGKPNLGEEQGEVEGVLTSTEDGDQEDSEDGLPRQAGRQTGFGAVQSSAAVENRAGDDCTTLLRSRCGAQDAGEGRDDPRR